MSSGTNGILGLLVFGAIGLAAIHGWFSGKSRKLKEDEFNQALRQQLNEEKRLLGQKIELINRELNSVCAESISCAYTGALRHLTTKRRMSSTYMIVLY
jgi:hypothetical protein